MLRLHNYDVVFTDIRFPDGELGLDFLNFYQNNYSGRAFGILAASLSPQEQEQAVKLGAAIFSKPIRENDLRSWLLGVAHRQKTPSNPAIKSNPVVKQQIQALQPDTIAVSALRSAQTVLGYALKLTQPRQLQLIEGMGLALGSAATLDFIEALAKTLNEDDLEELYDRLDSLKIFSESEREDFIVYLKVHYNEVKNGGKSTYRYWYLEFQTIKGREQKNLLDSPILQEDFAQLTIQEQHKLLFSKVKEEYRNSEVSALCLEALQKYQKSLVS
ncbi:hypothetical protein [Merismopedia glauca]